MRPVIRLNQNSIINFLILEISCTAIKYFLVQAIPGGYVYNSMANVLISLLLILVLVPALMAAFREKPVTVGLMVLAFVFIILSQILIFPENASTILSNLVKMSGMSLGCLIVANTLTEYEIFYYRLVKVSKIIICFAILEFITHEFFGVVGSDQSVDYDMSFGFFLVVPTLTQFAEICSNKKKKRWEVLFFAIGTTMAVMMGSRGSILAIFIGCVLCYYQKSKLRNVKDIEGVIFCCVVAILLYMNYRQISSFVYEMLLDHGINSRFFSMLAYGDITYSAGRDILQEGVAELISQHPWFGSGMLANTSSHNIFYEVILFYGYPIGIVLIAIIVFEWAKTIFVEDFFKRRLMAIFVSYAAVDSLLNLTVLGKDMFWIYLGLAFSTKLHIKRNKK